jgi:glycosyltransferase involved in cell wall biosynthesis
MLRQAKRPDLLVEIALKAPTVRFLVCGGATSHSSPAGYSERAIGALQALPNVDFLGQVTPDTAHRIIANAAMLLSTSDAEGFPNTFLEAWANGTPVVSLKIDPDRIIERHQIGKVSGCVEHAAADIVALIDSPREREEMASRSRRYVANAHSEAAVATAFQDAISRFPRSGSNICAG